VTQRLVARSRTTPRVLILPVPLGAFQLPKPAPGGPATVFPLAENQELASILLRPAAPSTFSEAIQARFTLASPATCICASCNIRRARWKVSLRPMAASACSARPHPEDQSRVQRPCTDQGMENDYSARKDVPVTIKCVPQQILFSGFGGRKGLSSMGKISTAGVPSAALGTGSSDSAPQALYHR
jgi:hypothetical protein